MYATEISNIFSDRLFVEVKELSSLNTAVDKSKKPVRRNRFSLL